VLPIIYIYTRGWIYTLFLRNYEFVSKTHYYILITIIGHKHHQTDHNYINPFLLKLKHTIDVSQKKKNTQLIAANKILENILTFSHMRKINCIHLISKKDVENDSRADKIFLTWLQ
jgi:hypothetical protein